MLTLENKTIYQCEYCYKRFVTKRGAKGHEEQYCYLSPIPKQKRKEKFMNCNHEFETAWTYIPGEAVIQPDYDECIHCGVESSEWNQMEKEELTCSKA